MIRCICLDDKSRPVEIPASKWVKEKDEYHITHFWYCVEQKVQGVDLYEKPLDGCAPYEHFRVSRFGIHKDHWEAFLQLVKDCTDLKDIDVMKLLNDCPALMPELIEN